MQMDKIKSLRIQQACMEYMRFQLELNKVWFKVLNSVQRDEPYVIPHVQVMMSTMYSDHSETDEGWEKNTHKYSLFIQTSSQPTIYPVQDYDSFVYTALDEHMQIMDEQRWPNLIRSGVVIRPKSYNIATEYIAGVDAAEDNTDSSEITLFGVNHSTPLEIEHRYGDYTISTEDLPTLEQLQEQYNSFEFETNDVQQTNNDDDAVEDVVDIQPTEQDKQYNSSVEFYKNLILKLFK